MLLIYLKSSASSAPHTWQESRRVDLLPTLTSGPSPVSGLASLHLIPNTLVSRLASDTVDNTNARFLTHPVFLKSSSPRSHIYAHSPNCFRFLLNGFFPSRRSPLQALQFSSFFSIAFMTTW